VLCSLLPKIIAKCFAVLNYFIKYYLDLQKPTKIVTYLSRKTMKNSLVKL